MPGWRDAVSRPAIDPTAVLHPTALVEPGASIGARTRVWDSVHVRGPGTSIGHDCIVGEKSYLAYGVRIGNRVKVNAFVYVCTAVTIEDGVMVSAGTIFTNDVFPRATTPDLAALRPSEPDGHTRPTLVRTGATLGARTLVGPSVEIGRWAMTGMGAVVTRSVPDFHLVVGHPARAVACVCRCGEPFVRFPAGCAAPDGRSTCASCGRCYDVRDGVVRELGGEDLP